MIIGKMMKEIPVLFENKDCLILNKPSGLAVQGGEGVGVSLDSILAAARKERPLLVHRLDKDTSGVILVAKNREAAAHFSALFGGNRPGTTNAAGKNTARRGILKQYLAVCSGTPRPDRGVIRLDLEIRGQSKKSETSYRRLSAGNFGCSGGSVAENTPETGAGPAFSLLELELGTGRMHQIRRHLAQIGFPILGDDKYGDFPLNKALRKKWGLKHLLLHASRLIIPQESIDVTAPLPEYWQPVTFCLPACFI